MVVHGWFGRLAPVVFASAFTLVASLTLFSCVGMADDPAPPLGGEVIRERYPNGAVRIERHVIQNENGDYVNDGAFTLFAPDGKRLGGGNFVLGKRNGLWTKWMYREESPLLQEAIYAPYQEPFLSEASFVEGQIEGLWTIYDRNKQKVSEWSFLAGAPHGIWTWYYPNGQKLRELTYVNGIPDGKVTQWNQAGIANGSEQYVGGRLRKFEVAWYGPGRKHWEGWYLYGKENTKTTYDWWLGQASTIVVSVAGGKVRDGKWTWWFPNGQKESEGAFAGGAKIGPWTWWHPNGQKWTHGDYVLDQQSGKWTWWNPEGIVEKHREFPVIAAPPGTGGEQEDPVLVESGAPATVESAALPGTAPAVESPPVTSDSIEVESAPPVTAPAPITEAAPSIVPAPVGEPAPSAESPPTTVPAPIDESPAPAPDDVSPSTSG